MLTNDQKADILDRILELLQEDMHMEQVCYCHDCHFWGTFSERTEGSPLFNFYERHCRKYGQDKIWDDYCSEGIRSARREDNG